MQNVIHFNKGEQPTLREGMIEGTVFLYHQTRERLY